MTDKLEIHHTRDILGRKCVIDCRGCKIANAIKDSVDAERGRWLDKCRAAGFNPGVSFEENIRDIRESGIR